MIESIVGENGIEERLGIVRLWRGSQCTSLAEPWIAFGWRKRGDRSP